jgi:hypothetical protein
MTSSPMHILYTSQYPQSITSLMSLDTNYFFPAIYIDRGWRGVILLIIFLTSGLYSNSSLVFALKLFTKEMNCVHAVFTSMKSNVEYTGRILFSAERESPN